MSRIARIFRCRCRGIGGRHPLPVAAGRRGGGDSRRRGHRPVVAGAELQPAVRQSRRRDASQVVQSLEQNGIPYQLENGTGAIMVPAELVSDARHEDLPPRACQVRGGYSLMEKDPGFGVSQFMENARYQHALETELARTIASLKPVRGRARASGGAAAVRVRARSASGQRVGIPAAALGSAAGSRAGDMPSSTSLRRVFPSCPPSRSPSWTARGGCSSAPDQNSEFAAREQQLELARRMEEDLFAAHRIAADAAARCRVACAHRWWRTIEMSTTEEAREQYRPESQVVRSEQIQRGTEPQRRRRAGCAGCARRTSRPQGGTVAPPVAAGAAAAVPLTVRRPRCRASPENSRVRRRATTRSTARWPIRGSLRVGCSACRWRC